MILSSMVLPVASVSTEDYLEVKSLCENGVLGKNYAEFIASVNQKMQHAALLEIKAKRVSIDPSELQMWLGDRKANKEDLKGFALYIYRKSGKFSAATVKGKIKDYVETWDGTKGSLVKPAKASKI